MPSAERIKRKMLRQAVEENLAVIRGLPPPNLRRPRRLLRSWGPRVATILITTGLGVGIWYGADLRAELPAGAPRITASALASGVRTASLEVNPAPEISTSEASFRNAGTQIPPSVLGLSVRRIVIDAGHGGGSPGTISPDGTYEKDLTLDIALRLAETLRADGFDVRMTRETDTDLTLSRRAELANESGADIFVSIHLNALRNRARRGVETYYLGPTNDPYLTEVAAHENRDSGYSVADLRKLLDGIYAGARQDESRRLAESVQSTLYSRLKKVSADLDDRGVKTAPFVVLVTTGMPAILAEVSCLSHDEETKLLKTPEYRQTIAEALAEGIHQYASPTRLAIQKGTHQNNVETR